MSVSAGPSSLSCVSIRSSPPPPRRKGSLNPILAWRVFEGQRSELHHQRINSGKSSHFICRVIKLKGKLLKKSLVLFATPEDHKAHNEPSIAFEQENLHIVKEEKHPESRSSFHVERSDGKSGFISFYGLPYKRPDSILVSHPREGKSNPFWFIGPTVLVASLVFPSLYLRTIISTVFEDSLLTDFLILFFTEALFYIGVAIYVFLTDHTQKSRNKMTSINIYSPNDGMLYRIPSVTIMVLSLIIPLVTMGLVWPWTGPAASATLAPYLVGLIVQFAFEQYARYRKSVSWSVIPVVFQVYRLHQLNRAAQLVTALSFSVRHAEATPQTMAINSSLGTLLNVIHFLGVICIWSLSSFLMRFFPSNAAPDS